MNISPVAIVLSSSSSSRSASLVGDRHVQQARPPPQPGRRLLGADRRAAQAPPRPDPQPGRDRQGVRRPRARHPRSGRRRPLPRGRPPAAEPGVAQRAQAESALSATLGRLFALAESYPDLKANHNFAALQSELASTEDKIAYARQFYNTAVQGLQDVVTSFPSSIVAAMTGVKAAPLLPGHRRRAGPGAGAVLSVHARRHRRRRRRGRRLARPVRADPVRHPGPHRALRTVHSGPRTRPAPARAGQPARHPLAARRGRRRGDPARPRRPRLLRDPPGRRRPGAQHDPPRGQARRGRCGRTSCGSCNGYGRRPSAASYR